MKQHRRDFFLATKTQKRTYPEARDEIHSSLERLQTDHVDLLQLHFLVDPQEWEVALGPGGALEAAVEAREQGLVRFIGVTGHELTVAKMHMRSLARFDFDSVLLPYNYPLVQNGEYAEDFDALIKLCAERNVAIQTIKSLARARWGEKERTRTTWYEPLEEQADIDLAVWWVLGLPGIFLNTAADIRVLPRLLDAAARFEKRPSDAEMGVLMRERELAPLFT